MSQKIEIDFLIDDIKALLSLKRQQLELDKLRRKFAELNGLGGNQVDIADKVAGKIRDAAMSFIGIGSAVAALSTAASIIQNEVAEIKRQQAQTGDAQVAYSRVLRAALRNVGTDAETGKPNISGPELQVLTESRAADAGVSPTEFTQSLSGALAGVSPSSAQDVNKAADIATAVLQIWGDLPLEEMKVTAGSIADFMKTNKVNAETAAGALLNLGAMHRTADTLPLANYALPGAVRTQAVGGTIQEGIGGVAYMSQTMIDPNAEKSGSVWPKFVQELNEALPDLGSFEERLDFMVKTPEFANVFFGGGKYGDKKYDKPNLGHGEAIPFLRNLVADPKEMTKYKEYVKNAGDAAQWTQVFSNNLKELNSTGAIAAAKIKQAAQGAVEGMALTQQGLAGIARDQLNDMLAQSGVGWVGQQMSGVSFEMNTLMGAVAPIDEVVRQLKERVRDIREPLVSETNEFGMVIRKRQRGSPSAEDVDVAEKIEKVVVQLETQAAAYKSRKEIETKLRTQTTDPIRQLDVVKQTVETDPEFTADKGSKAIEKVRDIRQNVDAKPFDEKVKQAVQQHSDVVIKAIRLRMAADAAQETVRPQWKPKPAVLAKPGTSSQTTPEASSVATVPAATTTQKPEDRLAQSLDANTQALRENTRVTAATKPASGKPSATVVGRQQVVTKPAYKPKQRSAPVVANAQSGKGSQ